MQKFTTCHTITYPLIHGLLQMVVLSPDCCILLLSAGRQREWMVPHSDLAASRNFIQRIQKCWS